MQITIPLPDAPMVLHLPAGVLHWDEEAFFSFCQSNREMRIERTAQGEIIVMSPAGGYSGYQSGAVFRQLSLWSDADATGIAFDSSTGFRLPNGAMRAPDAAWVQRSRLAALTRREKEKFIPLCPDFLIEVASPSDVVSEQRNKMKEYLECGLRLGWLLLPASKQAEIFTPRGTETLNFPAGLHADPVLPGFHLELELVWNPPF